jgi:hypothetical protein
MLLCIEMALFSVFHLWAFPWKVYDVRRSRIVAAECAPGFLPDPKTAYQGGHFGSRALLDAFNPWDLVKNVGRGFKWFAIGRRRRMDDISYKNSTHGTGLEPTRNQHTAFDNAGNSSIDGGPQPYIGGGGKRSRYQPLGDDDDVDHLLTHAQTNPRDPSPNSTYPRPMERLPNRKPHTGGGGGDISQMGTYDPPPLKPPHKNLPYPTDSNSIVGAQESGTFDPSIQSTNTNLQDTSYHGAGAGAGTGARRTLTPTTIPPDTHPLGPPGRKSHEADEWNMFGGVAGGERESERDLGGGHGVGDNRF